VTFRMRGWQEVGEQAAAAVDANEQTRWLVVADRAAASELAFYLPDKPRVAHYHEERAITSQYDLWPIDKNWFAGSTVVVTRRETAPPQALATALGGLTPWAEIDQPLGGDRRLAYTLWRAEGVVCWPPRREVATERPVEHIAAPNMPELR
jgi:hypothetical protein